MGAGRTTLLIHCSYWPRRGTNPHSHPSLRDMMLYKYRYSRSLHTSILNMDAASTSTTTTPTRCNNTRTELTSQSVSDLMMALLLQASRYCRGGCVATCPRCRMRTSRRYVSHKDRLSVSVAPASHSRASL
jgi:hypothetical protein